jgi:hypothetical protein
MHFALLSFITNPLLIAASLICVTTTSITLTNHPIINTSSACAIYWLILLKIVPFGFVCIFLITFSQDSAPNALVICPWIFHSSI